MSGIFFMWNVLIHKGDDLYSEVLVLCCFLAKLMG